MADPDAKAILTQALSEYGLASLADWAWKRYLEVGSTAQVFVELRQQQAYKDRFPAMEQLAKAGNAISEAAYINYEQTVRGLLQQYGIPQGVYDKPTDIAEMLVNNVAAPEVNTRLRIATEAAYNAPPEVKQALIDRYGISGGDLTAFYLDPDRALPAIEQGYATAQVTGAARRQQINVDLQTAERLAQQGVSYEDATTGFGQVAAMQGLEAVQGEAVTQAELVAGQFGDQAAASKVDRVRKGRLAQFQQGQGAAAQQSGVSALGSTR